MSLQRPFVSAVLTAGLALTLVACGGDSTPESASSPSGTPSATPTPTPTASSSTPSVVPTTPPAPAPRTKATLTKALLALGDLPAGFAVDPETGGDDGTELSATGSKCAKLVQLFNAEATPGSKLGVHRGFSGGQNGPFVGETLEAMPSAAATTAYLATVKAAVKACPKAKLTIEGAGSSTVTVTEVAAPKAGTTPVAVRFAAASGPLEGLEVVFAFTGLGDVLLTMDFDRSDIEEPVVDAVAKASKVLGTSTGT
ncbi:hypothetical protein EV652_110116 [Kribbella steppae]|uniref:PknH-like protein n=1 Tax=Kribbella steppae TaxID=2512223 RepID=A0A4R2H7C8_9ACTN|nr:hypothetical protein [Kribbella steppae]TCO22131.1 hypothetical protein EV652_110116 [Kribbella steppae]